MAVGLFSSVTLLMRTEYWISVTSRENGAVQEMVTELALLLALRSPTADSRPEKRMMLLPTLSNIQVKLSLELCL